MARDVAGDVLFLGALVCLGTVLIAVPLHRGLPAPELPPRIAAGSAACEHLVAVLQAWQRAERDGDVAAMAASATAAQVARRTAALWRLGWRPGEPVADGPGPMLAELPVLEAGSRGRKAWLVLELPPRLREAGLAPAPRLCVVEFAAEGACWLVAGNREHQFAAGTDLVAAAVALIPD